MENNDESGEVKNIIQVLLKAKKISRMYPQNNPVCVKIKKDLSDAFSAFFNYADSLSLTIGKNNIFYNSQTVYHNPEKPDNFALLFF